jgi:hypothetical protein
MRLLPAHGIYANRTPTLTHVFQSVHRKCREIGPSARRGVTTALTSRTVRHCKVGSTKGSRRDRGERESRYIVLRVSHASDDPSHHRSFQVRAVFDAMTRGWVARVAEQNRNEQRGVWGADLTDPERMPAFPTAAASLENAVAMVDCEAHDQA